MTEALEKRWSKMNHKLFLLAYVLHPARHLQHINPNLEFAYTTSIAGYAKQLYQHLFPCPDQQATAVCKQNPIYMAKAGTFSDSMSEYTDNREDPGTFWQLMSQPAPQLAKLATHLFQIAVNSAAVERLFSDFTNIQTRRRSSLVHERVQKLATIKYMLPKKPRSKSKAAGRKYLSRSSTFSPETVQTARTKIAEETQQQYVDGPADMIVDQQQVDDLLQDYQQRVQDDDADDEEYAVPLLGVNRCKMVDLFVDMPEFDMVLLFEDELAEADSELE